jgi:SAM-dependent methyltransferase
VKDQHPATSVVNDELARISGEVPAMYARMEESHWWFRGRRRILRRLLSRFLRAGPRDILDIGCGTGGMLPFLNQFGRARGIERDPDLVRYGRSFGRDVECRDFSQPSELSSVDVATLFDVLEHLEDDRSALACIARLLKPEGLLVVSVPALPWLWSPHDQAVGHFRRYDRATLAKRLQEAGFNILHLTYFNTLLMPVAVLFRLLRRQEGHDVRMPPPMLNELFAALFEMESAWACGSGLGIGVSLAAVAVRAPASDQVSAAR